LYEYESKGSLAGEGAVMLAVNGLDSGAIAKVELLDLIHTEDPELLKGRMAQSIESTGFGQKEGDLLLSGENGDNRLKIYFQTFLSLFKPDLTVARFKHMSGEYPTASAIGCWLACQIIQSQHLPTHMIKDSAISPSLIRRILLYNCYKGCQHSLVQVSSIT
jgi:hypothetical protein